MMDVNKINNRFLLLIELCRILGQLDYEKSCNEEGCLESKRELNLSSNQLHECICYISLTWSN